MHGGAGTCMDELVVAVLLFRLWAVLSLPAQGVLHPGCCFHGIVAHPLGCQKTGFGCLR